jgi:hypothetical protein
MNASLLAAAKQNGDAAQGPPPLIFDERKMRASAYGLAPEFYWRGGAGAGWVGHKFEGSIPEAARNACA